MNQPVFKLISRHTSLDRALKQLNPNRSRPNRSRVYASSKLHKLHRARRLPCCLVKLSFHMDALSWVENMDTRTKEARPTRIVLLLPLLLSCFSRVRLSATPWTAAHQAPPSMGFSRQEYWSALSSGF